MGLESRFEGAGLLFGEAANGRSATDFHVMLADDFRAGGGDQFGDGFAREEGAGEIDDVWIAEQIIEKWFDGGLAVWAAQLEQHHCNFFWPTHRAPLADSSSVAAIAASAVRFPRASG